MERNGDQSSEKIMKTKRLPVGKRNLRVELEATSEGNRTATVGIDVSTIQFARS